MAQISTVLVPALVIQYKNTVMGWDQNSTTIYGQVLNIPCRNDFIDDANNWWMVPVKDDGIFTGLNPTPAVGPYLSTPPTFDSIQVFRVRDKLSGNTWWAYGTWQQFIESCSTCCGASAVPMPGTSGGIFFNFAPCQNSCSFDEAGNATFVFSIPTLGAGQTYHPYGSYNNVALQAATSEGYATTNDLLNFLNSGTGWSDFTWSLNGTTLLAVTETPPTEDIALCVIVNNISPSA